MKGYSKTAIQDTYHEKLRIDLVNNKKDALLVNGLALLVMLLFVYPLMKEGVGLGRKGELSTLLKEVVSAVVLTMLYMPLHEAVHGVAMRLFTREKLRFGYKVLSAYAGSDEAVFNPIEYSLIALAPLVVFHLLFSLCKELFPAWRFVWIFLIAMNTSGSMGDVYVFCRISPKWKQPLLVNDTGTDMMVYEKN